MTTIITITIYYSMTQLDHCSAYAFIHLTVLSIHKSSVKSTVAQGNRASYAAELSLISTITCFTEVVCDLIDSVDNNEIFRTTVKVYLNICIMDKTESVSLFANVTDYSTQGKETILGRPDGLSTL